MNMVSPASFKVVGNASSTTSSAGRALRIELAEIEAGEIAEKAPELHEQRIGEPVLLGKLGARLERGIQGQIEIGRIARQPGEKEDEDDQAQQRDQAVQTAPGEILPQPTSPGPRHSTGGPVPPMRWRRSQGSSGPLSQPPTMPRTPPLIKNWHG